MDIAVKTGDGFLIFPFEDGILSIEAEARALFDADTDEEGCAAIAASGTRGVDCCWAIAAGCAGSRWKSSAADDKKYRNRPQ